LHTNEIKQEKEIRWTELNELINQLSHEKEMISLKINEIKVAN
jgi:hypothetical protein